MTNQVWANIGSGTIEQTRAILPAAQRGNQPEGLGLRNGVQVMIGNPEDLLAVDAFAASGITVGGSTPVEIIGPHSNPLPRCRKIVVYNQTENTTVFIGHQNSVDLLLNQGFPIEHDHAAGPGDHSNPTEFPLLHNVSLWAISDGTSDVRILIF